MKRIFLVLAVVFSLVQLGYSQKVNVLELGLRFNQFETIAIDATVPLAAKPRLHPTFYFGNNSTALGAYFDWLFPVQDVENFKLYPGLGPELYFNSGGVDVGLAGNFGMEYSFDIPLSLGFDWRPALVLTNGGTFNSNNWGFIARYRLK